MKKSKVETPAPSPEHRAAIDRLPTKPGKCAVCDDELVCVKVEQWRGDGFPHPPMRFACTEHDVWLGFCFDDGYPDDKDYQGGLYDAVLRDVSDPHWNWLPERLRAAAVKCGFSARYPDEPIGWRLTSRGDRAWVTDGRMMLDIGDLAEGEAALDRTGCAGWGHARAEETKIFRVDPDAVAPVFSGLTMAVVAEVTEAPDLPAYYGAVMVGSVAVARHYLDFTEAAWPGIRWYITGGLDPVFGMVGREARAVVMPIRTE